jgi:hypothetical protein
MPLSDGSSILFYMGKDIDSGDTSVGWVIYDTADPTHIFARSNDPLIAGDAFPYTRGDAPWMCNLANDVSFGGARPLGNDSFELFLGAAGAQIAAVEVKVDIQA